MSRNDADDADSTEHDHPTARTLTPKTAPAPDDWTDDEVAAAVNGRNLDDRANELGDWTLRGDWRINDTRGALRIEHPDGTREDLTDDKLIKYETHQFGWIKGGPASSLYILDNGFALFLRAFTQGAGTRGYRPEYVGPYTFIRDDHDRLCAAPYMGGDRDD